MNLSFDYWGQEREGSGQAEGQAEGGGGGGGGHFAVLAQTGGQRRREQADARAAIAKRTPALRGSKERVKVPGIPNTSNTAVKDAEKFARSHLVYRCLIFSIIFSRFAYIYSIMKVDPNGKLVEMSPFLPDLAILDTLQYNTRWAWNSLLISQCFRVSSWNAYRFFVASKPRQRADICKMMSIVIMKSCLPEAQKPQMV